MGEQSKLGQTAILVQMRAKENQKKTKSKSQVRKQHNTIRIRTKII